MSMSYDNYLKQHKDGVAKAYHWIKENLPNLIDGKITNDWQFVYEHDTSKIDQDEYKAYDRYFYGGNQSFEVVQDFRRAWLHHIHNNPHHWQHWVLINDDPDEGEIIMDMPYNYIMEMICDWWSFSWNTGNLNEIFSWYDDHKNYMKLSEHTRNTVEHILNTIKMKLQNF